MPDVCYTTSVGRETTTYLENQKATRQHNDKKEEENTMTENQKTAAELLSDLIDDALQKGDFADLTKLATELRHGTDAKKAIARAAREVRMSQLKKVNAHVPPTKGVDSGAPGKLLELAIANAQGKSEKCGVSGARQADAYINIDGKARPVEVKSNGGQVEKLERLYQQGDTENRYVIYAQCKVNKNAAYGLHFVIEPRIYTLECFGAMLTRATVVRNTINKGVAHRNLQPSSANLQEMAETYGLPVSLEEKSFFDSADIEAACRFESWRWETVEERDRRLHHDD